MVYNKHKNSLITCITHWPLSRTQVPMQLEDAPSTKHKANAKNASICLPFLQSYQPVEKDGENKQGKGCSDE